MPDADGQEARATRDSGGTYPVGLTDHLNQHSESHTAAESYPVGLTVQSVGRTGATRGYPVGRTG
jgi:hypothetical protein